MDRPLCNRARVVAKPQPSIARLLATGALSRECLTAQRKKPAQRKIFRLCKFESKNNTPQPSINNFKDVSKLRWDQGENPRYAIKLFDAYNSSSTLIPANEPIQKTNYYERIMSTTMQFPTITGIYYPLLIANYTNK